MKTNKKRVFAIIGLAFIFLLILSFTASAFCGSVRMFQSLLLCIWAIPILIWVCIGLYGKITGKKTIADLFSETEEEKRIKEDTYHMHNNLSSTPEEYNDSSVSENK